MSHRFGDIAADQRLTRRDRSRSEPEGDGILVVDDGHLAPVGALAGSSHRSASRNRVVGAVGIAEGLQQGAGIVDAEHGPRAEDVIGQRPEPASSVALLPGPTHGRPRQLDQVGGAGVVTGGEGVADRGGAVAVALVPGAPPPVEHRQQVGMRVEQVRARSTSAKRW